MWLMWQYQPTRKLCVFFKGEFTASWPDFWQQACASSSTKRYLVTCRSLTCLSFSCLSSLTCLPIRLSHLPHPSLSPSPLALTCVISLTCLLCVTCVTCPITPSLSLSPVSSISFAQICPALDHAALVLVNSLLETIPVRTEVDQFIGIDYSLIDDPVVTSRSLDMHFRVKITWDYLM